MRAPTQLTDGQSLDLLIEKVISQCKLFEGNNPLKTNTVLQLKDKRIAFKTV